MISFCSDKRNVIVVRSVSDCVAPAFRERRAVCSQLSRYSSLGWVLRAFWLQFYQDFFIYSTGAKLLHSNSGKATCWVAKIWHPATIFSSRQAIWQKASWFIGKQTNNKKKAQQAFKSVRVILPIAICHLLHICLPWNIVVTIFLSDI